MATVPFFLKRLTAIAVKVQSGRGTDAVPTLSADAVTLIGTPPTVKVDYLEKNDRDVTFGGLGNAGGQPGPAGKYLTVDLVIEPGGLGTAPTSSTFNRVLDALLRGSKHARTFTTTATFPGGVTGASAWDYLPSDTADEVLSVYAWADGKLLKAIDGVCTFKIGGVANKPGAVSCSLSARFVSMAAGTPSGLSLSAVVPPLWSGAQATYGTGLDSLDSTNSFVPQSWEVDEAITVAALPSGGAVLDGSGATNATGIVGHFVSDRKPTLKLSMLQPPLSVYDPYTEADNPNAAATRRLSVVLGNPTVAGNRILIQTGAVQATVPETGDKDGVATYDITGKIIYGTEPIGSRDLLIRVG